MILMNSLSSRLVQPSGLFRLILTLMVAYLTSTLSSSSLTVSQKQMARVIPDLFSPVGSLSTLLVHFSLLPEEALLVLLGCLVLGMVSLLVEGCGYYYNATLISGLVKVALYKKRY